MKGIMAGIIIFVLAISAISVNAYASDYKGEENRGSVFQVLGDFITGKYKVNGKPLKEKGVLQAIADQTKKMELSDRMDSTKDESR